MELNDLPRRIFLDTCALNFILDYGECIFEGTEPPTGTNDRVARDIQAFYNIFLTGRRASWQLAISPFTHAEVLKTKSPTAKRYLENWFMDVWSYWITFLDTTSELQSFSDTEKTKIAALSSGSLDALPDIEDRILICDALAYKCDYFCTRDWRTILRHRTEMVRLPIKIVTPVEWWELIRPFAPLWA